MSRSLLALVLFTFVVRSATAADEETVKAVLDKATRAMGGEEKLAKLHALTARGDVDLDVMGVPFLLTKCEFTLLGTDQLRWDYKGLSDDGRPEHIRFLVTREKGYSLLDGKVKEELTADSCGTVLALLRCYRLGQNPQLLRGKGFKLSLLGEERIDKRDTVGVKANQEGAPELNLFFDKNTGLLHKAKFRVKSKDGEKEVPYECLFLEYKEFDGLKIPTFFQFEAKAQPLITPRMGAVELNDIKVREKLDENTFAKPEKK